ncbi:TniQ family protein [Frigidibacter sp. MR17.14]|uniref:TniQ family protein n=1 Tax=Frigidibacter sp. MR17.14 TaxID=3126509 RepID=UPI003013157C
MMPADRETLPSFLSRLAAEKNVETQAFAQDLAGSYKRLLNGEPRAIEELKSWARLSDTSCNEVLSWTGVFDAGVRTMFRGESVISRSLRSPVVRGCPACLREDANARPFAPLTAMAMRGHWQLLEVSACNRHARLLVPLWEEQERSRRLDMQARLAERLPEILTGGLDGEEVELSAFDLWIDARLEGRADEGWLAPIGTSWVARFCDALGDGLVAPTTAWEDPIKRRHLTCAAGYDVAAKGREAVRRLFLETATAWKEVGDPIKRRFVRLFSYLDVHWRDHAEVDVFRDLVREAMFEISPIGAGELVLGRPLAERRLHSVVTAAAASGVSENRLRPLLVEGGALSAEDPRPDARATFDAPRYARLLADIAQLVDDKAMRNALGATAVEMRALECDGVLVPRTFVENSRIRWHPADAERFLAKLSGRLVSPASAAGETWVPIHRAQTRAGISVGRVIAAVLDGHVRVTWADGEGRYSSFRVELAELRRHVEAEDRKASDRPAHLEGASLSAFGREIGWRDAARVMRLVETGVLEVSMVLNPRTQRSQWQVAPESLAAFRQRFLTFGMVATEFGIETLSSRAWVAAANVEPASIGGVVLDGVYPRPVFEKILAERGAVRRVE